MPALAATQRGTPLGIPGAPDSLPAATDLFAGGWSVCTDADATNAALIAGGAPGGRNLGAEAVYGQTSNGDQYLIWHNRRYLIADPRVVVPVPLKGAGSPRSLPDVVINALPPGSDLKAIPIDHGQPSSVGNLTTGAVVYTGDGDQRVYGLVRPTDIAIITPLQKDILGDEGTGVPIHVDQQVFDGAAPSLGVGADWPVAGASVRQHGHEPVRGHDRRRRGVRGAASVPVRRPAPISSPASPAWSSRVGALRWCVRPRHPDPPVRSRPDRPTCSPMTASAFRSRTPTRSRALVTPRRRY